jgi:phosphoribosylaminoimidazole-succinocarboxamide synthase
MVVRGNLTVHSWRTYASGKRELCGVNMPEGMKENDFFPSPIITPSTKAETGHDEDISKEEILQRGLATDEEWKVLEKYALKLFERVRKSQNKEIDTLPTPNMSLESSMMLSI